MGSPVIKTRCLRKTFGHKDCLRGIDLDIEAGEFCFLLGANGAGKSTLLLILSGLLKPSSGKIYIKGEDMQKNNNGLRSSIGLVSHRGFLYPHLTVLENLKFYGNLFSIPCLKQRTEEILEGVGLLQRMNEPVYSLSRGMHQRLALARAVLHHPEILLLDEPFSGLDQRYREKVTNLLYEYNREGGTIIMTTHTLDEGLEVGSRFVLLSNGRVVLNRVKDSGTRVLDDITSIICEEGHGVF